MYSRFLKRLVDIVLALIAIIMLAPVFAIVAISIKLDSKGPILFKQKRVGADKTLFTIFKFRTMYVDTPKNMPTHLLASPDSYITVVGKFLRKTSLDELPQLFNIFVGSMSVIGPRPALYNQVDLIGEREEAGASELKPGLSGLAQVMGRDTLSIEEKAKLDGLYGQKMSFVTDVKLIFSTIRKVVKRDGIQEGAS
ncbi:sugar transferase [Paenilisteria rocourtiae]|uniref:O-antigen biosynthesis protein WbqP n=1 Tax=Listeria rocourtiae TaxID=647910 RepID=A0A4R6ZGC6_9LIST|nr:sugar transferase [Listeria rocourtiae]EUJ44808.1 glycosyl transferase [Listeria rocourtiae FSL F6-920]TDR51203.1 O-antigen biosynthesis protein WbqP [Listeria rocourtiae]